MLSRRELIDRLTMLGFDADAPAGWRDSFSDQQLSAARDVIIARLEASARQREQEEHAEEEPEFPDISEMVDAIEKATVVLAHQETLNSSSSMASRSMTVLMRDTALPGALKACRDILNRIEIASAALAAASKEAGHAP